MASSSSSCLPVHADDQCSFCDDYQPHPEPPPPWTALSEDDHCSFCDAFHPHPVPPFPEVVWLTGFKCKQIGCYRRATPPHKYCCAACCKWHPWMISTSPYQHHRRCDPDAFSLTIPNVPANTAHRGLVFMFSFGINNPGSDWLLSMFDRWSTTAHYDTWNQVHKVYTARTDLRLWGHNREAQEEFLQVHGALAEVNLEKTLWLMDWYLNRGFTHCAIAIACSAGHHRSCAHTEIAKRRAQVRFPNTMISLLHLDGKHSWVTREHDDPSSTLVARALDEHTHPDRYRPQPTDAMFEEFQRAYHASLQNPPPFLLHE